MLSLQHFERIDTNLALLAPNFLITTPQGSQFFSVRELNRQSTVSRLARVIAKVLPEVYKDLSST